MAFFPTSASAQLSHNMSIHGASVKIKLRPRVLNGVLVILGPGTRANRI